MTTGVSAVGASGAGATPRPSAAAKADMDYNAFLRLFVASMKNQDPTKPNDPAQTLSQLASFSNVEQSIKLNDKLDRLVASSSAALAATLIGKGVSSLDGAVAGTVKAVENGATGLSALLEDGRKLDLSNGYMITAP